MAGSIGGVAAWRRPAAEQSFDFFSRPVVVVVVVWSSGAPLDRVPPGVLSHTTPPWDGAWKPQAPPPWATLRLTPQGGLPTLPFYPSHLPFSFLSRSSWGVPPRRMLRSGEVGRGGWEVRRGTNHPPEQDDDVF